MGGNGLDALLGAQREVSGKNSFLWVDGTEMDYENWASGEPNNGYGYGYKEGDSEPEFVHVNTTYGGEKAEAEGIDFGNCDEPFTIELKLPCDPGWTLLAATNSCYKAFGAITTVDARANCTAMNANVASVHSDEENAFIRDLMLKEYYPNGELPDKDLIGMLGAQKDLNNYRIFYWDDGSDSGGLLTSIQSEAENVLIGEWLILKGLTSTMWIGGLMMSLNRDEFDVHWLDEKALEYRNWDTDPKEQRNYCTARPADGKFIQAQCDESYFGVCKRKLNPVGDVSIWGLPTSQGDMTEENECEDGWISAPQFSRCYKVILDKMTFYAAMLACRDENSYLISLSADGDEQEYFLKATTEHARAIIGWMDTRATTVRLSIKATTVFPFRQPAALYMKRNATTSTTQSASEK
ncbi:unnamed protein product, partial [Mesorhabditis spiculigera]